ncbi:RNase HII [Caloramator fervidus]|uniref:Ribonuclease HII n=1 Tax=Caloramator fervidus TaxID=29344 RepID=A0A1H5XBE2_9CLOT|nr:ribonuclease HII [Caloramator fervidus]SEG09072.1 RNase HII [Caloramator fervidus]
MLKLKQIEEILAQCNNLDEIEKLKVQIMKEDNRKNVIKLFEKYERRLKIKMDLEREYQERCKYENQLCEKYKYIAGVDEVGRGPLAGPVFAAAVILDIKKPIIGIRDSKKLTEKARLELSKKIQETAIDFSIGYATVEEIDKYNILEATKIAMKRAVDSLKVFPDFLLIDAIDLDLGIPYLSLIKGDDLSVSIGAASIIAKVERDKYMKEISAKYPYYDFEKNKGYGTKKHIESILKYGPCEIHRKSFLKGILGDII